MTIARIFIVLTLVFAFATAGLAQTSESAVQTQPPPSPSQTAPAPSGKALVYGGASLFAGGVATALFGFIRVGNGEYSTFGEATSRNKPLGAAGLAAAFAGGTMMFLGTRAQRYAPSSVAIDRGGVSMAKTITW